MGDINSVVIVGRLTRDSELRYGASGVALCNFSVAVNRRVKKGDEWTDEASFIDLTLFGKTAENLNKHLVKGCQVAVQGSLKQDRWEKEGKTQSKLGIFVDNVQLLGGWKSGSSTGSPSQSSPSQDQGSQFDPRDYESDIPF